jgi:hypothetical protein
MHVDVHNLAHGKSIMGRLNYKKDHGTNYLETYFLIQHLIECKKLGLLVQGESTLWGGHVGYFYNKYYNMHFF